MIQRGLPLFAAAFIGLLCACSSYVSTWNTYCLYVMDRGKQQNTFPEFSFSIADTLYETNARSRSVKVVLDCDNWVFRYVAKEPLPPEILALHGKAKRAYFEEHGIIDLGWINRSGWQEIKSIEIQRKPPLNMSRIDYGSYGWGARILTFATDDTGTFPMRVVTASDTFNTVMHVSDSIVVDRACKVNSETKRKFLLGPMDCIRVMFKNVKSMLSLPGSRNYMARESMAQAAGYIKSSLESLGIPTRGQDFTVDSAEYTNVCLCGVGEKLL